MTQFPKNNGSIVQQASSGIQVYMSQVYSWMTIGLAITALVAWFALNNPQIQYILATNPILFFGLIIAQFGVVIALSAAMRKLSPSAATFMFILYSALTGLTFSLILKQYTQASIVSTFVVTAGMFGAMSFIGYTTKRDLTRMGSFLFMGLIGIVLASLVNLFLQSPAITWMVTYIGVIVFVGLTAYDTQKLKELGEQIDVNDTGTLRKYTIFGALTLYLDFINLFIMLLRIIGDRR